MRVPLHAHFHCMDPDCTEQSAQVISSPSDISYWVPGGWSRKNQMLLCSSHSYQAEMICDTKLGGHFQAIPNQQGSSHCDRCGGQFFV